MKIGTKTVDKESPVYIVAEIGINHNGDLALAKKMIDLASLAGCDAVKFQKRTPEICVPQDQRDAMRTTPWGNMSYFDYRKRIEFGKDAYEQIHNYARIKGIDWFASCWDVPSVDFLEQFDPVCYKIPSACLTDDELLQYVNRTGRPVILSTGMSTLRQIRHAISILDRPEIVITHTTSSYPCSPDDLNLQMIKTLEKEFLRPVGYSGHEVGLQTTYAAVALGACLIERHVTLDRHMWGSDHAASVESTGLFRLVRDIRIIEKALGDGIKQVYECERDSIVRLRRVG